MFFDHLHQFMQKFVYFSERLDPDKPTFVFCILLLFFFFPTGVSALRDKCIIHAPLSIVHTLLSRDF